MTADSIGLLIPKDRIARVIGKGGSNLKQIREASGCQLQVESDEEEYGGGNRRVNLVGTREQQCMAVDCAIKKAFSDPMVEVSIRIPVEWAGRVVGKGGENLRRVREEFSIRAQVERDPVSHPTTGAQERVITLTGLMGNLYQALVITVGNGPAGTAGAGKGGMPAPMGASSFTTYGPPLMAGLPGMPSSMFLSPQQQQQLMLQQQQQHMLLMMMGAGNGDPNMAMMGGLPMGGSSSPMPTGAGGYAESLGFVAGGGKPGVASPMLSQVRAIDSDPDQMQLHFVVPGAFAGAVLGKGGAQIKQTAASSGCRMSMTTRDGVTDRRVVMLGTYQQCAVAQQLLVEQIMEAASSSGGAFSKVTVSQLVRKDAVGAVIGKGGAMLKQLREQSGAQIQLKREEIEGQRPCVITGTPQQVLQAERLVFEVCKSAITPSGSLNL